MKRILLLMLLGMLSTIAIAQTTWTGLGANTNWNNTDNWDTNLVPTAADDVIIPSGFTVILNVSGTVQSIDVQGNSTFEMNSSFSFAGDSNFGPNTTINWNAGTLLGTAFTLTNQGEMNLLGNSGKSLVTGTILDNEGTMNISSTGDLFINGASTTLNNQVDGILNMKVAGGNITWAGAPGVINNLGMIKRTDSTGEAQIITTLNNTNGTIQVEEGILSFQSSPKSFTDGTYNVFSGATLDWDVPVTISGSLGGTLDGNMNWNSNITVADGDAADLNFSENFNWLVGTLSGGGTLTNNGAISLLGNSAKTISGETTLNNLGSISIMSAGDLFINGASTILNNQLGGNIDLQFDGGNITWAAAPGVINNLGMIKKTVSTGEAQIIATLNNTNGTIQVEEGILSFQSSPKSFTDGTYNVFSGATLDWDVPVTISGSLGGTLDGNMNWNSNITVADGDAADLNFSENFNWLVGTLSGGGTLTNNGAISLLGNSAKTISGETTLNNLGSISIMSAGDLFINGASTTLNNQVDGILNMKVAGGNITWAGAPGVINNLGMIKRTDSTGEAQIIATLNNTNGTIQVEEGILSFQSSPKSFTDGTYNVFSGATLDWDVPVTISGSLGGTLDGNMNWNSNITVADGDVADLNFSENFNWLVGTLSGGGTLTNNGAISLLGNSAKTISGETTLNNLGSISIMSAGDLFINGASTILNNQLGGNIDLQFDGGNITWAGASGVLNNFGLLRRSENTGVAQIFVGLNNSGIIEVASGELEITSSSPFANLEGGVIKGIGVFDLPLVANYTNNGIFAPGLSPGTLTVQGDYTSTATSQLEMELNGLTPDTEYDVLAITGNNNVFEGSVNVIMGFEGTLGDEFTIATTTGAITTANLQSPIENIDYDGKRYTFEVSYPDNNKVVLTIIDKLDILPPDIITQDITVQLDASGTASIMASQVDNGTTDNCTPTNELQFSLDITDFTCADIGDNTVTLTVTDNDGNFANAQDTVTVEDVINPTVVTQDITVQLDASG
ncbi:beta strand repeat-containing protein, partial [uncultured Psychroserpens sp.]|uniref:beta strand repeat-containing protein n=1 Tax=uncultured Psychroserpens sp. TaxID=255436 RepID=UPI00345D7655